MKKGDEGCMVALLALMAIPVLVVGSAIANGFVLSVLWGWFVIPVFELPKLGVVQAIGLSMVVGFLTYHYTESKTEKDKSALEKLLTDLLMVVLRPAFVLFFGWIVYQFM